MTTVVQGAKLTQCRTTTVQDGQQITQNILGEHKVITTEQQFLGVILSFFMHLRWPWLSRFFA